MDSSYSTLNAVEPSYFEEQSSMASPPDSYKLVLHPPHFFKIVLQRNLEDRKLMIPKKFVRDYGKFLSSPVRLKLPDGMEWKLGLMKTAINGALWLQNGWHRFAEHYCLEFGSLLVFRFDGSSTFHTTIFEPTGSEIEYSYNFNDSSEDFEDHDDSDQSLDSFPRHPKKREKASFPCHQPRKKMRNEGSYLPKMEPEEGCNHFRDMPSSEDEVSRRRQPLSSAAKKPETAQRFSSLKSEKPGFKVVMGKSNVGGRFDMIIPKEFAGKHLAEEFGTIRIQTSDGRTWRLFLYKWSRCQGNFAYISSGWKRFAEENLLKEGDVGFFQLIKKNQLLFTIEEAPTPKKKAAAPATPRNPFFEVDIRYRSYKSSAVNIPMGFCREHLSPGMHTAKLQVGNKQWKVTVKEYERHIRFSAGWGAFCRENCLEDRDTCLFELLKKKDSSCAFKVTIFKKATTSVD